MTWNFDGGNYIETCCLASYRRLQKYVYTPLLYESKVTINLFKNFFFVLCSEFNEANLL